MESADHSISLERATEDPDYLARQLDELGIVLHPLLVADRRKRVDATRGFGVPPFAKWPARDRATFERICGPVQLALGYETGAAWIADPTNEHRGGGSAIGLTDVQLSPTRVEVKRVGKRVRCKVAQAHPNAHLLLGASTGSWHEMAKDAGVPCERDSWALCTLKARKSTLEARVFALYFGRDGRQLAKREVGVLRSGTRTQVPLAPPPKASHCAIALHFGGRGPGTLEIASLDLRWYAYPPGYRAPWRRS